MMNYKVYYAQNREDILLSGFFDDNEKGFYVDVGANDPNIDSVTKYFYLKGWNGINIEPIERHYEHLKKERPRDTNLRVGVAQKSGERTLREYVNGDGLSTFSKDMQAQYESGDDDHTAAFREYQVPMMTLRDILAKEKVPAVSFMKVDVEGFEYEVLASNDWKKYRPSVLCVEANHVNKGSDWHDLLIKHEYEKIFFDGLNEYYVDKKKPEIAHRFSYIETMFRTPLVPDKIDEDFQRVRADLLNTETLVTRERIESDRLRQEVTQLTFQLHDAKRIRNLLKMLVRSVHDAFLAYIELLNKPTTQKKYDLEIPSKDMKAHDVLLAVREYDTKTFYSTKADGRLLYRSVKAAYLSVARGSRRLAKSIIHGVRKRK